MAWAPANVYGPVGADGEIAAHDDVWDDGIHEDSIQCTQHPGACIEKCADGQWCRYWNCPKCEGKGWTNEQYHYQCHEGYEILGAYGPCKIHRGWLPLTALVDAQGGSP